YYALGVAASGGGERGASILMSIPERDPLIRNINNRFAAMTLLSYGRRAEAKQILDHVPRLNREAQLAGVGAILDLSPPEANWDEQALEAYEIRPDDVEALRELMRRFAASGRADVAVRFALRVQTLYPEDPES